VSQFEIGDALDRWAREMEDWADMKRAAVFILIAGLSAAVGFGLAFGVIGLWGAVQGPFLPEWDDTWRERIPVGLAYLTWGATIVAGLIVAWRVTRRPQSS
jgi:hypothetical protein